MTVFPRALIGAAACLAVAGAQAQMAACPNPIPIALTTPLSSGIALLGIQAKLGVEQALHGHGGGVGHRVRVQPQRVAEVVPSE